jgi:hypothetical protein
MGAIAGADIVTTPVFEGRFLRLLLARQDGDHLFVTFDHWHRGRQGFGEATPGALFQRQGWSWLRVQAARNDWFLNAELPGALAAAARCADGFRRVTTYGFSMGGYGALRGAAAIGAARAVAISPQASPDPARTPFERRWPQARAAADPRLDDFGGLDGWRTEVIAVYDPRTTADAAQIEVLRDRLPGLMALPLPFGGHPATRVVREGGRLGHFAIQLLTARLDRAVLLDHHKRARRNSALYCDALTTALLARRGGPTIG